MPERAPLPVLGDFEQLVLLALMRLGSEAYGATVCAEIESRARREVSLSAVHTTLERLEQKRLVRSRLGEPTPRRGGRRKRHFEILPPGLRALQASLGTLRRMTDGLEGLQEEPA